MVIFRVLSYSVAIFSDPFWVVSVIIFFYYAYHIFSTWLSTICSVLISAFAKDFFNEARFSSSHLGIIENEFPKIMSVEYFS